MRKTMSSGRRMTAIGVTAGVLGGGVVGLAFGVPALTSAAVVQQEETPTENTAADPIDTTEEGTDTTGDARPAPGARLRELLQQLVDDGTLTSAQADTVATFLVENRPQRVGHGHPGRGGVRLARAELAELFGLERDELRDRLREGQALADIAADQGVDLQTVSDTLVNAATEHLDEAVADGRLTQEEADAKLADLRERITERIESGNPDAD